MSHGDHTMRAYNRTLLKLLNDSIRLEWDDFISKIYSGFVKDMKNDLKLMIEPVNKSKDMQLYIYIDDGRMDEIKCDYKLSAALISSYNMIKNFYSGDAELARPEFLKALNNAVQKLHDHMDQEAKA